MSTEPAKRSFVPRCIIEWNLLPVPIRELPTKRQLKARWLRKKSSQAWSTKSSLNEKLPSIIPGSELKTQAYRWICSGRSWPKRLTVDVETRQRALPAMSPIRRAARCGEDKTSSRDVEFAGHLTWLINPLFQGWKWTVVSRGAGLYNQECKIWLIPQNQYNIMNIILYQSIGYEKHPDMSGHT